MSKKDDLIYGLKYANFCIGYNENKMFFQCSIALLLSPNCINFTRLKTQQFHCKYFAILFTYVTQIEDSRYVL